MEACQYAKNHKIRRLLGLPAEINSSSRQIIESVFQAMDKVSCARLWLIANIHNEFAGSQ